MTDTTTARPMRPTHHDDNPPVRGIGHLWHPVVSGGLIGVVGGGAFLFGGIAAYVGLNRRSELVAMRAAGVSTTFSRPCPARRDSPCPGACSAARAGCGSNPGW